MESIGYCNGKLPFTNFQSRESSPKVLRRINLDNYEPSTINFRRRTFDSFNIDGGPPPIPSKQNAVYHHIVKPAVDNHEMKNKILSPIPQTSNKYFISFQNKMLSPKKMFSFDNLQDTLNYEKQTSDTTNSKMQRDNNILDAEHSFRRRFSLSNNADQLPQKKRTVQNYEIIKRPQTDMNTTTFPIYNRSQSLNRPTTLSQLEEYDQMRREHNARCYERPHNNEIKNRRFSLISQQSHYELPSDRTRLCELDYENEGLKQTEVSLETWPVTIKSIAQKIKNPRQNSVNLNLHRPSVQPESPRPSQNYNVNKNNNYSNLQKSFFSKTIDASENVLPRKRINPKYNKRRCRSVHFASDVSVAQVMDDFPLILTQTSLKDN